MLRAMYYLNPQGYELGDELLEDDDEVQLRVLEVEGQPVTVMILTERQAARLASQRFELVKVEAGSEIV